MESWVAPFRLDCQTRSGVVVGVVADRGEGESGDEAAGEGGV